MVPRQPLTSQALRLPISSPSIMEVAPICWIVDLQMPYAEYKAIHRNLYRYYLISSSELPTYPFYLDMYVGAAMYRGESVAADSELVFPGAVTLMLLEAILRIE